MFAYRVKLNETNINVSQSEIKDSLVEEFNNVHSEQVDETGEVVAMK